MSLVDHQRPFVEKRALVEIFYTHRDP